jgi:site-specific recombinase XerD
LFLSRQHAPGGAPKPLCRSSAEKIIKRVLLGVAPNDPNGLSTHSLRKSWASRLYEESGHDLLCVRDGLGHSSVAVTQLYLPVNRQRLDELMAKADWTRAHHPSDPSFRRGRVSRYSA